MLRRLIGPVGEGGGGGGGGGRERMRRISLRLPRVPFPRRPFPRPFRRWFPWVLIRRIECQSIIMGGRWRNWFVERLRVSSPGNKSWKYVGTSARVPSVGIPMDRSRDSLVNRFLERSRLLTPSSTSLPFLTPFPASPNEAYQSKISSARLAVLQFRTYSSVNPNRARETRGSENGRRRDSRASSHERVGLSSQSSTPFGGGFYSSYIVSACPRLNVSLGLTRRTSSATLSTHASPISLPFPLPPPVAHLCLSPTSAFASSLPRLFLHSLDFSSLPNSSSKLLANRCKMGM